MRQKVFITTQDMQLAQRLIRLLYQNGIDAFLVTKEEDDPLNRQVGEALWPQWYDREELEHTRSVVGDREWSALFQQKPQADEGAYFEREWLRFYRDIPPNLTYWGGLRLRCDGQWRRLHRPWRHRSYCRSRHLHRGLVAWSRDH